MTQPESRLSQNIQMAFKKQGWFCFKVHGSALMTAGLPDIIVCAEGLFIGVEVKLPAKRKNTSPRQDYIHDKIKAAEGWAVVVCSPKEAVAAVKHAIAERDIHTSFREQWQASMMNES